MRQSSLSICDLADGPARATLARAGRTLPSIACLVVLVGCNAFDDLAATKMAAPGAARCGDCHVSIYEEWRRSPHARAFLSEEFLARTAHGELGECRACHTPDVLPEDLAERPRSREDHLEEGVHCLACHRLPAEHGTPGALMVGPLSSEAAVSPHPVLARSDRFRSSQFCGRCHEDTHAEVAHADANRPAGEIAAVSCQGCHMPSVTRTVTQATDALSSVLVAFEPVDSLRAHDFSAAAALGEMRRDEGAPAIEIDVVTRVDDATGVSTREIVVRNRLPHAIPTGSFGRRRVLVCLTLDDVPCERITLSTKRQPLAAGSELRLQVPEGAKVAQVQVRRQARDSRERDLVLAERRLELTPAGPELHRRARDPDPLDRARAPQPVPVP